MDTMEWKKVFKTNKTKWLILLGVFCMIVCGSVYACYCLNDDGQLADKVVNYFTSFRNGVTIESFVLSLISHLKLFGMIWALGVMTYLKKINIVFIGGVVFAYGFATTLFAGSMNLRDHFWLWISLILQGALIISYLIGFYRNSLENTMRIKSYLMQIGKGVVLLMGITVLEII